MLKCTASGKKNHKETEAETGIFSHDIDDDVSLIKYGSRSICGGKYVKYTINIPNYIKGLTINQINYVVIL